MAVRVQCNVHNLKLAHFVLSASLAAASGVGRHVAESRWTCMQRWEVGYTDTREAQGLRGLSFKLGT